MVVAIVGQSLRFHTMWQTRQKKPQPAREYSTEPANKQIVRANTQPERESDRDREKKTIRKHSKQQKEAPQTQ